MDRCLDNGFVAKPPKEMLSRAYFPVEKNEATGEE
jgi:hypothetical protein